MQPLITVILSLLSIFIPLTFTVINSELFEFPKFVILLSGTLVIAIAWILDLIYRRDFKVWANDTPRPLKYIHYGVIAMLVTQLVTTIFSINPYTSFWGYYSRYHGGLATTLCYTILYFAAVKWLDKKSTQKIIKISFGTAIFICIYGILEHFGIDKSLWKQDVQNRVFSTLGQPNWLAAYIIPNLYLTFYYFHKPGKRNYYLSTIFFLIFFSALIFTRSRSGLLALALSAPVYLYLSLRHTSLREVKKWLIPSAITAAVILAIYGSAYTPSLASLIQTKTNPEPVRQAQGTALETGGTESGDIRKIVWTGALKLITEHPFFGTGPETFGYTYYWVRPAAHNLTSEWDYIYNKAHNEYLNVAAGSGLIGLLAYLAWHYSLFASGLIKLPKSKKINNFENDELRSYLPVLSASVVAFFVTNFFGFSVIPVYFLMIILSALPETINKQPSQSSSLPIEVYPLTTILAVISLYLPIKIWLADYYYTIGKANLDKNNITNSLPYLEKSIKLRPGLDLFHSSLGEAYSALAATANTSTDEGVKAQTQKYLGLAVKEAEITKVQNKYHLNYYRSRAKIYLMLATIDPTFNNRAVIELKEARDLAPSDPKLAYNLGLVYTRINKLDLAESQFLDAIKLKSNYADPYYAATLLFEQTKQLAKVSPLLTSAKANLATYSAQLKEKIDKYVTQ